MNYPNHHSHPFTAQKLHKLALAVLLIGSRPLHPHADGSADVLTYHNDLARTGQNLNETILTPANVNVNDFGKLFDYPVDGYVYAQPLYMAGISVPGKGIRNLVFVATEHNSVYAFDADNGEGDNATPLWQVSFIDPAAGLTTVPVSDYGLSDPIEIGITGTPVIDPSTGTLFVVAKIKDTSGASKRYFDRLYALDIATGATKLGGPVDIQVSTVGTGAGADGLGSIAFNPFYGFQRTGLTLLNGVVYVAFASAGDEGPYHGWIIGYDAETLQSVQVFNTTPNGFQGGIWMSGGAMPADDAGNIYCMTGNGTFDADTAGADYGESFLKLAPSGDALAVADYFTPYDQEFLTSVDGDLGAGGPVLLPDLAGGDAHPHLMIGCGKEGIIYLLDRDNMGHYNPDDNSQVVQTVQASSLFGTPAYFNNQVYFGGVNDFLKAYNVALAQLSTSPISRSSIQFGYPGPTPSISADGINNALLWIIQADTFSSRGPAILRAYNATNLAEELYNSAASGSRDRLGLAQKYSVPTIANGKVYVATGFGLSVFGNLGPPVITTQPGSQTVDAGTDATFSVVARGTFPMNYQWQFNGAEIEGATGSTLVVAGVQISNAGMYTVAVSNSLGSLLSAPAELIVNPPPAAPRLMINSQLEITIQGETGQTFTIEYAAGLDPNQFDWVPLSTLTLTNETQTITDPEAAGDSQRFYRAVVESF